MPRSIKRLKHRLKYVTTHKKRNILTNESYYEDVPTSLPILGANYFVLLTLDSYTEYSECFSTFSDAKKYALVMCVYYEAFKIYKTGTSNTPPDRKSVV